MTSSTRTRCSGKNQEFLIQNIMWKGKKSRLPFEFGILANILAVRSLRTDLQSVGFPYLLTWRTNQDGVENSFSCLRYLLNMFNFSRYRDNIHPCNIQFYWKVYTNHNLLNIYNFNSYTPCNIELFFLYNLIIFFRVLTKVASDPHLDSFQVLQQMKVQLICSNADYIVPVNRPWVEPRELTTL